MHSDNSTVRQNRRHNEARQPIQTCRRTQATPTPHAWQTQAKPRPHAWIGERDARGDVFLRGATRPEVRQTLPEQPRARPNKRTRAWGRRPSKPEPARPGRPERPRGSRPMGEPRRGRGTEEWSPSGAEAKMGRESCSSDRREQSLGSTPSRVPCRPTCISPTLRVNASSLLPCAGSVEHSWCS